MAVKPPARFVLRYVCDIIAHELDLDPDLVTLYNQKNLIPSIDGLVISVGMENPKMFGAKSQFVNGKEVQSVNVMGLIGINAMSRDTSALDRKEEIVMALGSVYSQQIQEKYGFSIARLPQSSPNLSIVEGAAIPYRFLISVNVNYVVTKTNDVDFYDVFSDPEVETEA